LSVFFFIWSSKACSGLDLGGDDWSAPVSLAFGRVVCVFRLDNCRRILQVLRKGYGCLFVDIRTAFKGGWDVGELQELSLLLISS
jgi:hypothetical protein